MLKHRAIANHSWHFAHPNSGAVLFSSKSLRQKGSLRTFVLQIKVFMKKNTLLQDFKAFALKGNVLDMAVGVIIGGAFGKIVSSLVADIIMPPIGLLVGGVNFTDLKWVMKPAVIEDGKEVAAAVTLNYGNFLQVTFDFLIIAFSIFLFIKLVTRLTARKKAETPGAPPTPPTPSREEELLAEIRDLLKNK